MGVAEELIAKKLFRDRQPVRESVFRNMAKRFYEVDRNLTDQLIQELQQADLISVEKKGFKSILKPRI